jgi:nucleoside-diphosphate-sugar epimerase
MKILVIGGNRFFGKRLVEKFARQHVDLTVMHRSPLAANLMGKAKHLQMDRKTLKRNHPALSGKTWDIVYDQVCYDATEALGACEAFEGKVGKYIFTSSESVYQTGSDLLESDFDPLTHSFDEVADRTLLYAEAKRQAEAAFFQKAKFPVTAIRFPNRHGRR